MSSIHLCCPFSPARKSPHIKLMELDIGIPLRTIPFSARVDTRIGHDSPKFKNS
jgi:hypothetical protein